MSMLSTLAEIFQLPATIVCYTIADEALSDYENAGIYANHLLEIYTEYKSIWKNLQVLAWEVQEGISKIEESKLPRDSEDYLRSFVGDGTACAESDLKKWTARLDQLAFEIRNKRMLALAMGAKNQRLAIALASVDEDDTNDYSSPERVELSQGNNSDDAEQRESGGTTKIRFPPVQVYPPSIIGLINARRDCRLEMVKVVNEVSKVWHEAINAFVNEIQVDLVTSDPSIALDPDRKQTFFSPALFKQLVPVSAFATKPFVSTF
jgi:hypothetical protein